MAAVSPFNADLPVRGITWFSGTPTKCKVKRKDAMNCSLPVMHDIINGLVAYASSQPKIFNLGKLEHRLPKPKCNKKSKDDQTSETYSEDDKYQRFSNKLEPKSSIEKGFELTRGAFVSEARDCERFGIAKYHYHPQSVQDGLLQFCSGIKRDYSVLVDNSVKEMDLFIKNPDTNICRDAMETTCRLELPGPFSFSIPPRYVKYNSDSNGMDVLGLLLVLVDALYATNTVSYVRYRGKLLPLELTTNSAKIIVVLSVAFPQLFEELQKLIMFSTVLNLLKKVPFKWNRCMIHVFEDLLLHPFNIFSVESIEMKLLSVIIKKRAKTIFKHIHAGSENFAKYSVKYKNLMSTNFTNVDVKEILDSMKSSAASFVKGHRVKNIKFKVNDEAFVKALTILFDSYC